jgi:hypothetical protein
MIVLKWVGDGKSVIPVFPPRDLTKEDLEKKLNSVASAKTLAELKKQLVDTGLYKLPTKKRVKDGND